MVKALTIEPPAVVTQPSQPIVELEMDEVNLAPTNTLNMEPTVAQPVGPSINQEIHDSDDVLSSPHVTEEHPNVQCARYKFLQAERILCRVEAAVPENRQGASSDAGLYLAHKEYKRAAHMLRDVSSYYEKKYAATAHKAANAPAVSHQPSPAKSFVSAFSPPSTSTPKKEGCGETATTMSSQVFRPFSPPFTQKQKGPIGTSTAVSSQVVQPFLLLPLQRGEALCQFETPLQVPALPLFGLQSLPIQVVSTILLWLGGIPVSIPVGKCHRFRTIQC